MGAIATRPNRYRLARTFAGLSLAQAAKQAGIALGSLAVIEDGACEAFDAEVDLLAKAYGVRPDWLRGEGPERLELDQVADAAFRQDLARLPEADRNPVLTVLAAIGEAPAVGSAVDVMDAFRRTRP